MTMSLDSKAYNERQVILQIEAGGRARRAAEYQLFDRFRYLVNQGMRKHGLSEDDAIDAYTDSILVLIRTIEDGKFQSQNKISTLLHAIFFRKCVDVFRKNANTLEITELMPESSTLPDRAQDILRNMMTQENVRRLRVFMLQLGQRCQEILWDSLYFGYRPAEIAEKYGLKNAETVLSQKSRCLKKLRETIHDSDASFDLN